MEEKIQLMLVMWFQAHQPQLAGNVQCVAPYGHRLWRNAQIAIPLKVYTETLELTW